MKKISKILLILICLISMLVSDPVFVLAKNDDAAQTAAKTVQVSSDEENIEENEEDQDSRDGIEEEDDDEDGETDAVLDRPDITEMTEIRIGNYDEWCNFARNCSLDSWSEDKYVVLTDNIECNMQKFVPVPLFAGVFDGAGHTINKAAFTEEQNYIGVFSKTAKTAVIRNLNVIGVFKPAGKPFDIGGIVGDNAGMIANCQYEGYVEGYDYIGGIAGYNEASGIISACSVTGKITGLHYVGGMCGANAGLVTGCSGNADINTVTKDIETSLADIKVEEVFTSLINLGREEGNKKSIANSTNPVDIGGMVGHNMGEISSCINASTVGYEHVGYNVGGIAGRQSGYVHDCANSGYIRGRKDVGGIVGQAEPYIRLDLSSDIIAQLSSSIEKLHDSVDRTINDTHSSSGVVSARLNVIKSFADRALGDTGYLANGTIDFVNGVTGATNEVVGRLEYVIDESSKSGGPVDDVAKAGGNLKDAAGDLEKAAEDLDIYNYMDDDEKTQYDAAKTNLKNATEEFSSDYSTEYEAKYPEHYDKKYYQLLTGAAAPPAARPDEAEITAAEEAARAAGKTDEDIAAYKEQAAKYAAQKADTDAAGYANTRYTANHGTVYSDDVRSYADTVSNIILKYSDKMEGNARADGKDAVKDIKSMAENLREAGETTRSIIGNVAGRSDVRFPQLSEEYRLHTNSLVANIQGMSDNLGFLNSEMKGSTDVVCKDLESVNDEFETLMLLFTDAMDGALDMDYSEIYEDESNDVCEDSTDATIADCTNTGSIYADINTGGIAGTMAEEYDFDLEGDITGVKDAAKKSTYRTKCVLRNDTNRGDVKGKKSYAGGACGLHEIGTILRCANFAKISSESSDYVGGIAGRSYATIRNSYEKGVLAGESYIGGIAGACVDVSDCVSMPTITKSVNFAGAIAGSSDDGGRLRGNVFVSETLAGVDRISMEEKAEPVSYFELMKREDVPGDFSVMKVDFTVDDKVVASVDKKEGEVISDIDTPAEADISKKNDDDTVHGDDKVCLNDDEYILWDIDGDVVVHEDMEIAGKIVRYTSSLASEQVRPNNQSVFLVDGRFVETDKLMLTAISQGDANVEEYVLTIPDDKQLVHRIRFQKSAEDEDITISVKNGDEYEEVPCEQFGKYITFTAGGNEVVVKCAVKEKGDHTKWYIIVGSAVAGLAAVSVVIGRLLLRRKNKKPKDKELQNNKSV
ncbi:MAG: hypothetical protein K6F87_04575 [Lachnospiraceae bacterium]|nr:hypothetical protein [Lachnospiraceae bacterium]